MFYRVLALDSKRDTWMVVIRVLLASPFLLSGATKLLSFFQTIPTEGGSIRAIEFLATYLAQGFSFFAALNNISPKLVVGALLLAGIVELVGGLMVVAGFRTRDTAITLIAYTLLVSAVFHLNWSLQTVDGQLQLVTFVKNMAIAAGLLALAAVGPGSMSVDRKQSAVPTQQSMM